MNWQQYLDNLVVQSCKVADVHHVSTMNDLFIEEVDASITQNSRNYWGTNEQADLTDIAFQAKQILSIQRISGKIQQATTQTQIRQGRIPVTREIAASERQK